jgi:hypothetical protein
MTAMLRKLCLDLPCLRFCLALLMLPHATTAQAALDDAACARLQAAGVIDARAPVGCDRLAIVRIPYIDFSGVRHDDGELMVLAAVAPEVSQLFHQLYQRGFPLARVRLIEHYRGDDDASMRDNNTSAFNNRQITGGGPPSLHAYGLAIDINPLQNPFVQPDGQGRIRVSPPEATAYLNRLSTRPDKPVRPGMAEAVVGLFAHYGFTAWGGYWDNPIDYQHFQFSRGMAQKLAAASTSNARRIYLQELETYRACLKNGANLATGRTGTTCALQ